MAQKYRECRVHAGLTQKQAAEALHVCETTYIRWEKGQREPHANDLVRMHELFGASVDELLGIDSLTLA